MSYSWILFLHIASALAFVGIHGTSMAVLYIVRRETDRVRVESLMRFSARTVVGTYLSLGAVVVTGFWMGFMVPSWFGQPWFWVSLAVLILVTGFMWLEARPFGKRILAACEIRPSGVPRVSDEELAEIIGSQRTNVITAIGVVGLALILYLMIFKPGF